MDDFLKGILSAPITTLLIVAGILFLLIAVVGNISGKIEPGVKGRIASGVLGFVFVTIGLAMHFTQESPQIPSTLQENSKSDQIKLPEMPPAKKIEVGSESTGTPPSVADIEPNDQIYAANLITEGITVRGSLATNQDRDFYRFNALGNSTRVILRKLSLPGFGATLEVYDAVEKKVAYDTEFADQPVTFAFESITGAVYYILVKPYNYKYHGDYELVMRNE